MNLETTNLLLGIMAAVSVLEAFVLLGAGIAGYVAYRRVMALVEGLEHRQLAPLIGRVNTILDDVKGVTSRVSEETDRVDQAIRGTVGRVDHTAERVRTTVRRRTRRLVGVLRGIRTAVSTFISATRPQPRAESPGQP